MSCFKKDGTLKKIYEDKILPDVLSAELSHVKMIIGNSDEYDCMRFKYNKKYKSHYSDLLNELGIKFVFWNDYCNMMIDPETLSLLRGGSNK